MSWSQFIVHLEFDDNTHHFSDTYFPPLVIFPGLYPSKLTQDVLFSGCTIFNEITQKGIALEDWNTVRNEWKGMMSRLHCRAFVGSHKLSQKHPKNHNTCGLIKQLISYFYHCLHLWPIHLTNHKMQKGFSSMFVTILVNKSHNSDTDRKRKTDRGAIHKLQGWGLGVGGGEGAVGL